MANFANDELKILSDPCCTNARCAECNPGRLWKAVLSRLRHL